jgi:hypothetical protein
MKRGKINLTCSNNFRLLQSENRAAHNVVTAETRLKVGGGFSSLPRARGMARKSFNQL